MELEVELKVISQLAMLLVNNIKNVEEKIKTIKLPTNAPVEVTPPRITTASPKMKVVVDGVFKEISIPLVHASTTADEESKKLQESIEYVVKDPRNASVYAECLRKQEDIMQAKRDELQAELFPTTITQMAADE